MNKLKKIGIATLISLALGTGMVKFDVHKHIIRNIMSHHPVRMSLDKLLLNLPEFIFTRGYYTGHPTHDLNAICLGLEENPFKESEYKPTSLTYSPDQKFYSIGDDLKIDLTPKPFEIIEPSFLKKILEMKEGDVISLPQSKYRAYTSFGNGLVNTYDFSSLIFFNYCTLSIGKDKNGCYLSFYDVWDYSDDTGYFKLSDSITDKIGSKIIPIFWKQLHFYERFYFKDYDITEKTLKEIYERRNK